MCDFDDFDDDDFMEGDSFEDEFNDDFFDDHGIELNEKKPDSDASEFDEFNEKDAFFIGSIVGNAYEENLDKRKQIKSLKKKKR